MANVEVSFKVDTSELDEFVEKARVVKSVVDEMSAELSRIVEAAMMKATLADYDATACKAETQEESASD